ncbi:hypothetical protein WA158_003165 [Blastocystis sp. Blastoise]
MESTPSSDIQKAQNRSKLYCVLFIYSLCFLMGLNEPSYEIVKRMGELDPNAIEFTLGDYFSFVGPLVACLLVNYFNLRVTCITTLSLYIAAYVLAFFKSVPVLFLIANLIHFLADGICDTFLMSACCLLFLGNKSALLMCMLSFCYGFGNTFKLPLIDWISSVFPASYIGVFIVFIVFYIFALVTAFFIDFSIPCFTKGKESNVGIKKSLTIPMTYISGITLGICTFVELNSKQGPQTYLQDRYGVDVDNFYQTFVIFFTISRLVSGYFLDLIGHLRSMVITLVIVFICTLIGMILKSNGFWAFIVNGFFVAIIWPVYYTVIMDIYKNDVMVPATVVYVINSVIVSLSMLLYSYVYNLNPLVGVHLNLVFCIVGIACVLFNQWIFKKRDAKKPEFNQFMQPLTA